MLEVNYCNNRFFEEDTVNFHIISDWFNHNKTDRNVRKSVKILVGEKRIPVF